jgi:photosystem II stability/assembly factor-like uncharacterized protein
MRTRIVGVFAIAVILASLFSVLNVYRVHSTIPSVLLSVCFIDENNGWAVGSYGLIVHTSDAGKTWKLQEWSGSGFSSCELTDVDFVDLNNGWAIQKSHLLHTTDGGETWEIQYTFNEWYTAIDFIDLQHGWAVCGWNQFGDYIMNTSDGGNSWTYQRMGVHGYCLWDVKFVNGTRGISVGSDRRIWTTSDSGETWEMQIIPDANLATLFRSVDFIDESEGWVCSENRVYRTTDSGVTWQFLFDANIQCLNAIKFANSTHGYIVGSSKIWETTNGGTNWNCVTLEGYWNAAVGIYADNVWITGGIETPECIGQAQVLKQKIGLWERQLSTQQTYEVSLGEETYYITTTSDSTITDLNYTTNSPAQIIFKVFGPPETFGYCNITIPKILFPDGVEIVVNCDNETLPCTISEDESNYILSFGYSHSIHHMTIKYMIYDVNGDKKCNLSDLIHVARRFGLNLGEEGYDPIYDVNDDDKINLSDLIKCARHFGEEYA